MQGLGTREHGAHLKQTGCPTLRVPANGSSFAGWTFAASLFLSLGWDDRQFANPQGREEANACRQCQKIIGDLYDAPR
jgi:hypothetical protein